MAILLVYPSPGLTGYIKESKPYNYVSFMGLYSGVKGPVSTRNNILVKAAIGFLAKSLLYILYCH